MAPPCDPQRRVLITIEIPLLPNNFGPTIPCVLALPPMVWRIPLQLPPILSKIRVGRDIPPRSVPAPDLPLAFREID